MSNPLTPPPGDRGTVTRLGNYELLEQLGAGGMGVVYKAQQVGLNRLVAVKVLNSEQVPKGHEATAKQRFLNEAQAMAKLNHPHIIPIYEVGEHLGVCYFSMRLIDGGDLSKKLDLFTNQLSRIASLVVKVAMALDHAHRNGVIHRDLKPQNILIDEKEQPSVTDFGLAKLTQDEVELTLSDQVLGSPHYMAPEQARGESKHVEGSADIFSLGVILYRLLTGQLPFNGANAYEIIHQIIERTPKLPSMLNSEVNDDLQFICLKCLEKDPTRRYTSGEHLAEDLLNWQHDWVAFTQYELAKRQLEAEHPELKRRSAADELFAKRRALAQSMEKADRATKRAMARLPAEKQAGLLAKLKLVFAKGLAPRQTAIRVILADDHPIVLAGIRAELERISGVEVIGVANDGGEALELVRRTPPDVVFMDIEMPGMNGVEATARINKELPQVRVIMLSRHDQEEYYALAFEAGASGYMLKSSAIREIGNALQRVMDGEIFLSQEIAGRLGKTLTLKRAA